MRLRDERILVAVLRVALDQARPEPVRVHAIRVASNYADSTFLPDIDTKMHVPGHVSFAVPVCNDCEQVSGGIAGRYRRQVGSQPVIGNPRDRLFTVLRQVMRAPGESQYMVAVARSLLAGYFKVDTLPGL